MTKYLYLEQRISMVRKMLNEDSIEFQAALPLHKTLEFRQYIIDMLNILDGLSSGNEAKSESNTA